MREPERRERRQRDTMQYEQAVLEIPEPPPRPRVEPDDERDRGVWTIELF